MGKFSNDVSRFVKKSKSATVDVPKKVAIDLFSSIVRDSPVLTGRLRANWQAEVGKAPENVIDKLDPTGGDAIGLIVWKITGHTLPDATFILRNNLPYAYPIEYEGHSGKAPDGMVRRNVARFEKLTEKIAKELN